MTNDFELAELERVVLASLQLEEVIKRYVILFVATDIQPIVSVYAGP